MRGLVRSIGIICPNSRRGIRHGFEQVSVAGRWRYRIGLCRGRNGRSRRERGRGGAGEEYSLAFHYLSLLVCRLAIKRRLTFTFPPDLMSGPGLGRQNHKCARGDKLRVNCWLT